MAYVLARQKTGCEPSAAKADTALNANFCGVFRVALVTSNTPRMSYLRCWRAFLLKRPGFASLVRFQIGALRMTI